VLPAFYLSTRRRNAAEELIAAVDLVTARHDPLSATWQQDWQLWRINVTLAL
jgi:hypothetical protein